MDMEELENNQAKSQPVDPAAPAYTDYRNPTYHIVSIVGYLIGVEKQNFAPPGERRLDETTFDKLEKNRNARVIRHLCRIRTAFEKNYGAIRNAFRYDIKKIGTIHNLIPTDSVNQLSQDGVNIYKGRPDVDDYIITINREISNRVNGVQLLFPEWIDWKYLRDLFLMPGGTKVEGIKAAGFEYNKNRNKYPFHCYINWRGGENGNILYCDEKFVTLLYECWEDYFENISLVRDVGNITKADIYNFLAESGRAIMVVDCENSDPVKLAAALSGLSPSSKAKIAKILLFDSEYTTASWGILAQAGDFPVEHVTVLRLNEKKSQVDMTLATRTCKEVYTNGVDSVILVSSDSDYWALIQSLSDIDFLVMVERRKCGSEILNALEQRDIVYCFLDDFCTNASYAIKTTTLLNELRARLDAALNVNIDNMLDDVIHNTWVQMTPKERQQFYDRYIKTMKLSIAPDGKLRLEIN
ncbi:MAG: NYN domain-containing protein [Oscillospiraceae bacterium]|nr:NYN domain-containing protein [Oscillospiraceae bacterium]